jgi:hypothetical protein
MDPIVELHEDDGTDGWGGGISTTTTTTTTLMTGSLWTTLHISCVSFVTVRSAHRHQFTLLILYFHSHLINRVSCPSSPPNAQS